MNYNFIKPRLYKPCVTMLFLFSISIVANPIRFQRDQINYIYQDARVNENHLNKFHSLFQQYYSKTFQELGAKTQYPLRVEIYSDAIKFNANTGMTSFTAAVFDTESSTFYFLLTPKTLSEDKLITIISHESCHAAIHSRTGALHTIMRGLEEGFCYLHYPSETILNRDVSGYCKLDFHELSLITERNLFSNDKKKREEVYLITSWFIRFLEKDRANGSIIQILLDKNKSEMLDKSWQIFKKKCSIENS